jgi:hypothetical protein
MLFLIIVLLVLLAPFIYVVALCLHDKFKSWILRQFGSNTMGKIISAHEGVDKPDLDLCIYGVYTYQDSHGREHRSEFCRAMHWPSGEQWDKLEQECSVGKEHTVYYLPCLPSIHEIQM